MINSEGKEENIINVWFVVLSDNTIFIYIANFVFTKKN